jgi:hypothetical protein
VYPWDLGIASLLKWQQYSLKNLKWYTKTHLFTRGFCNKWFTIYAKFTLWDETLEFHRSVFKEWRHFAYTEGRAKSYEWSLLSAYILHTLSGIMDSDRYYIPLVHNISEHTRLIKVLWWNNMFFPKHLPHLILKFHLLWKRSFPFTIMIIRTIHIE